MAEKKSTQPTFENSFAQKSFQTDQPTYSNSLRQNSSQSSQPTFQPNTNQPNTNLTQMSLEHVESNTLMCFDSIYGATTKDQNKK